ncbi:MAG: diguanylate cyclase/phosphodiesterase (GGDEF & EAL domains) with PAS/PAC sensor(s) [uncultured Sulfurovum sp.]|uniref:Diguanylate cyclase/phosphodiesterase (GGDEF & EAL domains) with PAS/PAC sensor(S) n=1 Tax=uncultured Sulfurovum sp. TaxID=269237 RepID=A0A6S6TP22_9BACT|nr:MAG: diguanylate cyclase/phosphodiesterase (GGDEF & EAL domains) with PAS/PAC sensor(s) [uncultured Sulfurovum sp.]
MTSDFSILYIEDDSLTQKIIVNVLGKHFSRIFVASDGIEGIKLYYEKKPDIVLSDISMPNLNGIEMTEEIKRHNPKQKVALFTGYNDLGYLNKAINIGVDKYILKPLDTKQMFTALDDIIESLKNEEEEEEYKEKLEFVSQHDDLTGLLNRRQFFFLLDKLQHRSNRENSSVAILGIDLNKFKPINDTYGHEAGDLVLKKVAQNLLSATRKEDIVARFGGDEFGIAIGFLKEKNKVFRWLDRIGKSFSEPLLYVDDDGIEHSIETSCSIGITFHEPSDKLPDLEALMRQADRAMYVAKVLKKPYSFFDEKEESKFKIKIQKSKEIKQGIDKNEFMLYYQPIIEIKTQKIVAYESLIRWQHPREGFLTPDKFLPYILDNREIITYLGNWIIEQVFLQYEKWLKEGHNVVLSINISFNELASKDFVSMLKNLLKKYPKVKAKQIIFEVVENIALKDIGLDESALEELKVLGFKIALDNFGIGLSTLSSIKCFNIDSIKIDKSFVINMLENKEDYSIVDASIQLSKAFGHVVVAEGVESKAHLSALLSLGCDWAQGFAINRPMSADKIFE